MTQEHEKPEYHYFVNKQRYEWHETPTGLHVYFQGSELTDIAETWTEATFSLLRLGFERFDTGTGGDIYIDDVAVNNEQIGCD